MDNWSFGSSWTIGLPRLRLESLVEATPTNCDVHIDVSYNHKYIHGLYLEENEGKRGCVWRRFIYHHVPNQEDSEGI